jgi:hypothetical protein
MPSTPSTPPPAFTPTARQRSTIYLTCTFLVLAAIMLLFVPSVKIPLPGRLTLAALNLIMAATLALIVRQKSNPPPAAKP